MSLQIRSIQQPKTTLPLGDSPIRLGRSPDNDVVLADPHASRRHAEIRMESGQAVVVDLGSKLGTFVNGQRIAERQALRPGDRLAFGSEQWEVVAAEAPALAPEPVPATANPAAEAAPHAPAKPVRVPRVRVPRRLAVALLVVVGVLFALLAAAGWAASDARGDALSANATLMALAQTPGVLRPERIAYLAAAPGGSRDIFAANADGSDSTALFRGAADQYVFDAEWSPAAAQIAFTMWPGEGSADLFVMNADGSDVVQITHSPNEELNLSWSPDGRRLAFDAFVTGTDRGQVYAMDADGSGLAQLTLGDEASFMPAWSPDGGRIAYVCGEDLCLMNADGSGSRGLSVTSRARPIAHPAWSPDGSRIAFTCALDICTVNTDGSGYARLTEDTAPEWGPRWLASGHILYTHQVGGDMQIRRMDAYGGNSTLVVWTPADEMTRLGR